MRRAFGIFLALCLILFVSVALAEDWVCASCGSTNSGNFCSNCGSAKPAKTAPGVSLPLELPDPADVFGVACLRTDEDDGVKYYFYELPDVYEDAYGKYENAYTMYMFRLLIQGMDFKMNTDYGWLNIDVNGTGEDTAALAVLDDSLMLAVDSSLFTQEVSSGELNRGQLSYYYMVAALKGHDTPYLTNIMGWRDGKEETSAIALAVRHPETGAVGILAGADIVSEGCDYYWQCGLERYPVTLYSPEETDGLVLFTLSSADDNAKVLEQFDIPHFDYPHANEEMIFVYCDLDEENEELLGRSEKIRISDSYKDYGDYQRIYQGTPDSLESDGFLFRYESIASWNKGIYGAYVNGDGNVCGIFISEMGSISPLPIDDGIFYGGVQSTEKTDVEVAAELLHAFSVTIPEGFDWENIGGWSELDRAKMSVYTIFALMFEDEYSGDIAFDWENMYSGAIRYVSGYEEFMLLAADGDDVLFLEYSMGSSDEGIILCQRMINADPSDMQATIKRIEQTTGATLNLTQNNSELMEVIVDAIIGEE